MKLIKLMQVVAVMVLSLSVAAPAAAAQTLSKAELKKLIATASTPQDHERIAKHFDAKAAQLDQEAAEHEALAAEYTRNPTGHQLKHPMSGQTAEHCKLFAAKFREAAKEARQLAADHREMAKTSEKK